MLKREVIISTAAVLLLMQPVAAGVMIGVYETCEDFKQAWSPLTTLPEDKCTIHDHLPGNADSYSLETNDSGTTCHLRTFSEQGDEPVCSWERRKMNLKVAMKSCHFDEESGVALACQEDVEHYSQIFLIFEVAGLVFLLVAATYAYHQLTTPGRINLDNEARRRESRRLRSRPPPGLAMPPNLQVPSISRQASFTIAGEDGDDADNDDRDHLITDELEADSKKPPWLYPLFRCTCDQQCWQAYCCPSWALAEIRRRYYGFEDTRCVIEGIGMTMADLALGAGFWRPATSIINAMTRIDMRLGRGYRGTPASDVVLSFLCEPCVIQQMERDQYFYDAAEMYRGLGTPSGVEMRAVRPSSAPLYTPPHLA